MPKNSSEYLTNNYGFITDYLAEAFHYQFSHSNRYEEVTKLIRLGVADGRVVNVYPAVVFDNHSRTGVVTGVN